MSETRVRVRIAVSVRPDGSYEVEGCYRTSDEYAISLLRECEGFEPAHFIEADIPLHQPQTIEGAVESEGA